jgi:hypothetical protein
MAPAKTRGRSTSRSSASSSRSRSSKSSKSNGSDDENDRYRRAAEDALQQLDWAIGYLHGIHKTEISKALAKNRSHIRTQLLGEPAEPDPSAQTDET